MEYKAIGFRSYRVDGEGQMELMANFEATIVREIHYQDGRAETTELVIVGSMPGEVSDSGEPEEVRLGEVRIRAEDFPSMSWVLPNWGVRAVIMPGTAVKDDLRTMIQSTSRPKVETVYKHIGWTGEGSRRMYVHAGGGITSGGLRVDVKTALPPELARYNITPRKEDKPKDAMTASLGVIDCTPSHVGFTLYAAMMTPVLAPVDFAVHITGRTGTYKSEVTSLYQSHYGAGMDARHLPASWSSTGNALEALAFLAKDAVMVTDDFIPQGSTWQVRAYQANADKLIRAQGNQAGRARLTDLSALQTTMYPRGIIISSGEDTPEGHSVRARMMILELSPGDVDLKQLTYSQKARAKFPSLMAQWIKYCAQIDPGLILKEAADERERHLGIGHSRTPGTIARLIVTWRRLGTFFTTLGMKASMAEEFVALATAAISAAGDLQAAYLEEMDPVDMFFRALRQTINSGKGHFKHVGGGPPNNAELLGWSKEEGYLDAVPQYKSVGKTIGWVRPEQDKLYLDAEAGYAMVRQVAGSELSLTRQTMLKRLKEAGRLTDYEENRQRNTTRIMAEGHSRTVLAFGLKQTLGNGEESTNGK